MKKAIFQSIFRRLAGYAGVGAVVGLENDAAQLGGLVTAAATLAWSIRARIREARKLAAAQKLLNNTPGV